MTVRNKGTKPASDGVATDVKTSKGSAEAIGDVKQNIEAALLMPHVGPGRSETVTVGYSVPASDSKIDVTVTSVSDMSTAKFRGELS